jgi:glutaminyl-tRNA synthetase
MITRSVSFAFRRYQSGKGSAGICRLDLRQRVMAGFDWGKHLYYSSDYFNQLYEFAEYLITQDKAYVESLSAEEIREYRGTLIHPGKNSPYRDRPAAENLDLFRRMKAGEFADGQYVLRAKIDMASPNINMRDPVIYRIRHVHHQRTGDQWCIYPMYDYTHCISDALERITHSLCTLGIRRSPPVVRLGAGSTDG